MARVFRPPCPVNRPERNKATTMDSHIQHLALLLDAPLQSWGYQSKFDRRTTLSFPTRSGVIGMICAAMGIDRGDSDALAKFADLQMTVYTLRIGNRLTDFHTVGGGWDKRRQSQNIVRTADGKTGNTVVTRREYLENSRFGVLLSGPTARLDAIAAALQNPRWGIWLGRKACIPASPVFQGLFDSAEAALEHLRATVAAIAGTDSPPTRVVSEVAEFADGSDTLMDRPLSFAERTFAPRRVAVDTP